MNVEIGKSIFGDEIRNNAKNNLRSILEKSELPHDIIFGGDRLLGNCVSILYENGIIDDSDLEEVLHYAAIAQGKRDYERLKKGNVWPDHLAQPEFLAYIILKKELSEHEISRINFDHGDTKETFCKTYDPRRIIAQLKENVLHPRKYKEIFEGLNKTLENSNYCSEHGCMESH